MKNKTVPLLDWFASFTFSSPGRKNAKREHKNIILTGAAKKSKNNKTVPNQVFIGANPQKAFDCCRQDRTRQNSLMTNPNIGKKIYQNGRERERERGRKKVICEQFKPFFFF